MLSRCFSFFFLTFLAFTIIGSSAQSVPANMSPTMIQPLEQSRPVPSPSPSQSRATLHPSADPLSESKPAVPSPAPETSTRSSFHPSVPSVPSPFSSRFVASDQQYAVPIHEYMTDLAHQYAESGAARDEEMKEYVARQKEMNLATAWSMPRQELREGEVKNEGSSGLSKDELQDIVQHEMKDNPSLVTIPPNASPLLQSHATTIYQRYVDAASNPAIQSAEEAKQVMNPYATAFTEPIRVASSEVQMNPIQLPTSFQQAPVPIAAPMPLRAERPEGWAPKPKP